MCVISASEATEPLQLVLKQMGRSLDDTGSVSAIPKRINYFVAASPQKTNIQIMKTDCKQTKIGRWKPGRGGCNEGWTSSFRDRRTWVRNPGLAGFRQDLTCVRCGGSNREVTCGGHAVELYVFECSLSSCCILLFSRVIQNLLKTYSRRNYNWQLIASSSTESRDH